MDVSSSVSPLSGIVVDMEVTALKSSQLRIHHRGTSQYYREERKDRKEHRKGHRTIDSSHHRTEKPQIAQMDSDSIAPSRFVAPASRGRCFRHTSSPSQAETPGVQRAECRLGESVVCDGSTMRSSLRWPWRSLRSLRFNRCSSGTHRRCAEGHETIVVGARSLRLCASAFFPAM